MKEITFVTGNLGKKATIEKHFDTSKVKVECYKYDFDEPNINCIEHIAKYKVLKAYEFLNKPCIALDAGFYVEAFPGQPNFPGTFVNRELLDKEKMGIDKFLEIMKDVENRNCYFKECLAYYDGKDIKYFFGVTEGTLTKEKLGISTNEKWSDLWYVFVPKNCTKTLMQMTEEERINRPDGHTNAIEEFKNWFESIQILEKR